LSQSAPKTVTAEASYQRLKSDRNAAESRAKQCATLTLPTLYKEVSKGKSSSSRTTPYQGTGARCVNSAAARFLMALLPVNANFFKLSPDGMDAQALAEQAGIQQGELEMGLAEIERTVINDIETSGMRGKISLALKHLVATGNGLLYIPDEGNAKFYPLSRFVVDRDGMGSVLEIVTLDSIAPSTMGDELKSILGLDQKKGATADAGPEQDVELYTRIFREGDLWQVFQEVNGAVVPGSEGSYPVDACPWIPLRIPEEDGEDYGAGLVYDYYGDFDALEKLSKAMLKGAAAAAKVLWALDENAAIRPKTITEAESGDVLRFRADQLKAVQQDKYGDFNFVGQHIDKLVARLEMAFGVRTAIQRNGERVTAEEIRYLAQELEEVQGGVYSILAEDLLLPLVRRQMDRLTRQHRLPELPAGLIKPRIVVGVAALGRGQDMRKLLDWAGATQQVLGPQVFAQRVNAGELMARMGAASDLSMKGLIKTDDEIAQEQQDATMHQAAIRAAPNIASAAMAPPTASGDPSGP
jgi:hypothetical protein